MGSNPEILWPDISLFAPSLGFFLPCLLRLPFFTIPLGLTFLLGLGFQSSFCLLGFLLPLLCSQKVTTHSLPLQPSATNNFLPLYSLHGLSSSWALSAISVYKFLSLPSDARVKLSWHLLDHFHPCWVGVRWTPHNRAIEIWIKWHKGPHTCCWRTMTALAATA